MFGAKFLKMCYNSNMNIIALKQKSKTNPNIFVAVTPQGEFALHIDIVVKNHIKKGEIDEDVFTRSVQESELLIAFSVASKYLASRLKTEQQIKDYLYKKGYHAQTVNSTIEKLKRCNLIDDNQYAESYIRSNKNFSRQKLKAKLLSAGVKNNLEQLDDYDELSACQKSVQKFLKNKAIDKQSIEKLTRRLASQGFSWDTITSVLNRLKEE